MTDLKRRILLGEISTAHGIRGEVLVRSFTAAPEDIAAYGPLENESGTRAFELAVVRVTPKGVIAHVDGIADRTAAEYLKGVKLYIAREKLPKTGDGEFYHADLIGLDALTPDGTEIGSILAVQNFGAGDLIEIRLKDSKQTELVPLTKACVPEIDLERGAVVVVMPELVETGEDPEAALAPGSEEP